MKIASKNQASLIASKLLAKDKHNYIKRESGITMVTPALSYFLHKGLCDFGYVNESFDLFKLRFDKMLENNHNGTLWEEWWLDATGRSGQLSKIKTRSDAQTESAFAPALFAEFLLGLKVIKPGMSIVEISKPETTIKHIQASVPTPQGDLEIEWNFDKNLIAASCSIVFWLGAPDNEVVKVVICPSKDFISLSCESDASSVVTCFAFKSSHRK